MLRGVLCSKRLGGPRQAGPRKVGDDNADLSTLGSPGRGELAGPLPGPVVFGGNNPEEAASGSFSRHRLC